MSDVDALLRHAQPGAPKSVRDHIRRAEKIAAAIRLRWEVDTVRGWRVKHLKWFLFEFGKNSAPATLYDHWRTIRAIAAALHKLEDWEPHLRGSWCRDGIGGRQPKLVRRTGHNPPNKSWG